MPCNVPAATARTRLAMKQSEYGVVPALQNTPPGMLKGSHILFLLSCLAATPAWARAQKTPGLKAPVLEASKQEPQKKSSVKPILALTLRPTWYQSETLFEMENSVEAGIQFSEKFALSYNQDFNTNISKTGNVSDAGDFTPSAQDGFLRMNFRKIRESDDKLTTFSDQVRVYFPTEPVKRDAGMVTIVRNYFVFDRKFSSTLNFTVYETPILHVYDRDSRTGSDGKQSANPVFENRFVIEPAISLTSKLTLGLPLNLYTVKFRDAGDKVDKSGEWIPNLTFSPWLELSVTDNLLFGLYYETGNFAEKTDSGLVWTDGQKSGLFQAYVRLGI